jgi:hypothetical protein
VKKVGPYEIQREIARGGMGVVYQVRHPNVPRPLALKLILDGGATPRFVQRFQREAQVLAKCDRHPNILKVHHMGEDQGRPFLVTDFIEGEPLAKTMPLEPKRAAAIVRKVADALAHVHAQGVLHRDVKPENILLRGDAPDEPVLIDFGLAWAADSERLTRTNATLGTPAYMPPEQAGGASGNKLDARADVYSLGATLYAALVGEPPFEGQNFQELVGQIMTMPARLPSESRKEVPEGLDAICHATLGKTPAERYASAAELRDDLARFLAGTPPLALARLPKRRRSRPRRVGLLALLALLVAGAALAIGLQVAERSHRAARAQALAAAFDAAKGASLARNTDEARTRLEALETALAKVGESREPRLERAAALLRAEAAAQDARGAAAAPQAAALEKAAAAGKAYLALPASEEDPELLGEVPRREAALAAGLSGGGTEDVARALLARSTAGSREVLLERARALLRLGLPAQAAAAASKVTGNDKLATDALEVAAVALLESRELGAARDTAKALAAIDRARASAIAVRIELAAGEVDAAARLAEAAPGNEPELVLARAEVDLARRAPTRAILPPVQQLLPRADRDAALWVRARELAARLEALDELERFGARDAPPGFERARALLAEVASRTEHAWLATDGAETARAALGRALVLLAALDRARGGAAGATAARASLRRAALVAPASVDVALALVCRAGVAPRVGPQEEPPAELRPALERASEEIPSLALALRDLARAPPGKPSSDLVATLERASKTAQGAAERATLRLIAGTGGEDDLRRAGTLDELLVEAARRRLAFEAEAEGALVHGLAARRVVDPALATDARDELEMGLLLGRAARLRGDAALASGALDLALVLRPAARSTAALRAEAASILVRAERQDPSRGGAVLPASSAGVVLVARKGGAAALAAAALEDLAGAPAPADELALARTLLVRGVLLDVAGTPADAIGPLREAVERAERVSASRDQEGATLVRLAEAARIRSSALDAIAGATQRMGDAVGATSAQATVDDDLEDRARAMEPPFRKLHALANFIGGREDPMGVVGDQIAPVVAATDEVVRSLRATPALVTPLEYTCTSYIECGRALDSWLVNARILVARGATATPYLQTLSRFHPYLVTSQGSGLDGAVLARTSVDEGTSGLAPDDAAGPLARGIRRALAAGSDRAELARADAELREAQRLAPGAAALLAWRGAVAVLDRRTTEARAWFDELEELGHWTGSAPFRLAFEAAVHARAGDFEGTRAALAAIRDSKERGPADAWQFEHEPLVLVAEKDAECRALLDAIRARPGAPPVRRGR